MTQDPAAHKTDYLQAFRQNAQLLKSRASRHAWIGMGIGIAAVVVATLVLAYMHRGDVHPLSLLLAQRDNPSLWLLDVMPFAFAFWGQYVNAIMAYEAGAMVMDQTSQLRAKNEALEREVRSSVTHDVLTGLPNWLLLLDRLEQAIRNARYEGQPLGVVRLGFDGFKEINDMVGYYNGDRVLKEIAHRIGEVVAEPDTVARPGGADFVVLLTKIRSHEEAEDMASRMEEALEAPFAVDEVGVSVQPRIGTAYFPDHGEDEETLLRSAYAAMAFAHRHGHKASTFSPDLKLA